MNKAEFIDELAERTGMSKSDAESAFSTVFDVLTDLLVKQDKISIPNFGTFSTKVRAERKGRNPATGEEITIPEAVVANFKVGTQLKEKLNK